MNKLTVPPKGKSAEMLAQLQAEHATEPDELAQEETKEDYKVTTLQPMVTLEPAPTSEPDVLSAPEAPPPLRNLLTEDPAIRTARFEVAMTRAHSDDIAVVTVRMPASLNRYVDSYVDRVNQLEPGRKYRKQDAIAEAFAAFYADHVMPPAPLDDDL